MGELLMVTDSRLAKARRTPSGEQRFTFVPRPGATLRSLIDLVNDRLTEDVNVVVVNGFHCDLTFLADYKAGVKGLMRMKNPVPIAELVNKVACWDYEWRRARGIETFWVLPYAPDFVLFNERRAKLRHPNGPGLDPYHLEEFQAAHGEMKLALNKIQNALTRRRVEWISMSGMLGAGALEGSVSDGLHISPQEQNRLLDQILAEVQRRRPLAPRAPTVLTPNSSQANRKRLKQRRQRARKNRRLTDQMRGSGVMPSSQFATRSVPAPAEQPGTSHSLVTTSGYMGSVGPSFLGSRERNTGVGRPGMPVDGDGEGEYLAEDMWESSDNEWAWEIRSTE